MTHDQAVTLTAALALAGALVLRLVWVLKARPKIRHFSRRISGVLDTLGGRDEITDEATGQKLPALQPLGVRLGNMEKAIERLANVQTAQVQFQRTLTDHEARIVSLEDIDAERTLTREEALAMWQALSNKDVIDVEGEER